MHFNDKKIKFASENKKVIARLCRAFFMHTDRERNVVTKRSEGWTLVIARLCRAFFMHITQQTNAEI